MKVFAVRVNFYIQFRVGAFRPAALMLRVLPIGIIFRFAIDSDARFAAS